jgi:DNA (cytosine-5)-methyltransferase 1
MKKLKVLDLFSGLGTWSYGLEKTQGYETVAFCEIDPYCRLVLKKHWPDIGIHSDVTKLYGKTYKGQIDVITASFPCTDISIGGAQKGLIDEEGNRTRSGLWFETARLIDEIRPRFALIENVGNLRKLGLDQVISDLSRIGYDCEWYTIRATDVELPHQRERLFIISYPSEFRRNECTGQKRHLQTDKERESTTLHPEGAECQPQSREIRPLLSRRTFEEFRAANPGRAAAVSGIRRVTDGIPTGIHERARRQRIKQLGNAILPDVAEIIGNAILTFTK